MKNSKWTYRDRKGREACALEPLARNIPLGYITGFKSFVLVSRIYPLGPSIIVTKPNTVEWTTIAKYTRIYIYIHIM